MTYRVNEMFYSLQGEGLRAGTANVFLRFSGCNLTCSADGEAGFDCDTEFVSGRQLSLQELVAEVVALFPSTAGRAVILTGGEPALQCDEPLVRALGDEGCYLAIETNGTKECVGGLSWITVSPKTAFHTLRQTEADEFKLVRRVGQALPKQVPVSGRERDLSRLVSPAFDTDPSETRKNLQWCIELVKVNPGWRLSVQQHKTWNVR